VDKKGKITMATTKVTSSTWGAPTPKTEGASVDYDIATGHWVVAGGGGTGATAIPAIDYDEHHITETDHTQGIRWSKFQNESEVLIVKIDLETSDMEVFHFERNQWLELTESTLGLSAACRQAEEALKENSKKVELTEELEEEEGWTI